MTPYIHQAASKARKEEPMSVIWENHERSANNIVWESVCKWMYRLSALGAAWWVICWAVTR